MMQKNNKHGYNRSVALCVLWIWLFFCVPDIFFDGYPKSDIWLLARQSAQTLLFLWTIVYLLLINRFVGSVLFPLLILCSAALLYFKFSIGSVFTPGVLDATVTADAQTASDLITPTLIIYVAVCTVAALYLSVFIRKKSKYKFSWRSLNIGLLVCCRIDMDEDIAAIGGGTPHSVQFVF
jgi:glucan phosphoethanolaminetransferase (alkaline phosphatase superfamily)